MQNTMCDVRSSIFDIQVVRDGLKLFCSFQKKGRGGKEGECCNFVEEYFKTILDKYFPFQSLCVNQKVVPSL